MESKQRHVLEACQLELQLELCIPSFRVPSFDPPSQNTALVILRVRVYGFMRSLYRCDAHRFRSVGKDAGHQTPMPIDSQRSVIHVLDCCSLLTLHGDYQLIVAFSVEAVTLNEYSLHASNECILTLSHLRSTPLVTWSNRMNIAVSKSCNSPLTLALLKRSLCFCSPRAKYSHSPRASPRLFSHSTPRQGTYGYPQPLRVHTISHIELRDSMRAIRDLITLRHLSYS